MNISVTLSYISSCRNRFLRMTRLMFLCRPRRGGGGWMKTRRDRTRTRRRRNGNGHWGVTWGVCVDMEWRDWHSEEIGDPFNEVMSHRRERERIRVTAILFFLFSFRCSSKTKNSCVPPSYPKSIGVPQNSAQRPLKWPISTTDISFWEICYRKGRIDTLQRDMIFGVPHDHIPIGIAWGKRESEGNERKRKNGERKKSKILCQKMKKKGK